MQRAGFCTLSGRGLVCACSAVVMGACMFPSALMSVSPAWAWTTKIKHTQVHYMLFVQPLLGLLKNIYPSLNLSKTSDSL